MSQRSLLLPLAFLLAAPLAGCLDAGEELDVVDAELEFNGTGSGDHSETADCDDSGTISGSGELDDGVVTVSVTDGGGQEVFREEYRDEFTVAETDLTGASGDWTLTAERAADDLAGDDFTGQYVFALTC